MTGVSDGTHAIVNAIDPHTLVVNFGAATEGLDQSTLLQYYNDPNNPTNLTGFLPSVAVTTLDRPFTVNNIPVSATNPNLTAEAISSYFQPPSVPGAEAVAPFAFPPPTTAASLTSTLAPYSEPVFSNAPINSTPTTFVSAQPVAGANGGLECDPVRRHVQRYVNGGPETRVNHRVTPRWSSPVPPTQAARSSGAAPVNAEGVPYNPTGSGPQVKILKQSGNEFEVNPALPASIYTQNIQAPNSTEPAVAMDGSGDFTITWTEQIAQEVAPKDITDIYFRRYSPVGLTDSFSGTAVPGLVTSDLNQQQQLTLDFTGVAGGVPTGNSDTFELQVGSTTVPGIVFDTNPVNTAANMETALVDAGFTSASVSPDYSSSTSTVFSFDVTFTQDAGVPAIQYVAADSTLPSTVVATAAPTQAFTGVRLLTNPTQHLVFQSTAAGTSVGTFELQLGSVTTGSISLNSSSLPATAANIQTALQNAGFSAATASVASDSTTTSFGFNITFDGASASDDLPAIQFVPIAMPSTLTGSMYTPLGDPYTQQANANYTNPQYDPAVAEDQYGNFVIVWANQGQDLSFFNNISMERYDKNGNPIAYVESVNNGALTNIDYLPDVAIGNDGNVVVTWSETADASYLVNSAAASVVYVRAFSAKSTPLWSEVDVGGGGASTVSMDGQDNFVVAWDVDADPDITGQTSEGVYAAQFELENYGIPGTTFANSATAAATAQQLTFNANSVPVTGTFQLQVGAVTTGAINFDSTNLATTATNMQAALVASGFTAATVTSVSTADPFQFDVTFAAPEAPIQYISGGVLAEPVVLRDTFRLNSSESPAVTTPHALPVTDTALPQTIWPFAQSAADVQVDLDGDIATTFEGNGPAVSENVDIPGTYFEPYFSSQQVQQLAFDFTAGVPAFNGTNDVFELQVALPAGTVTTGPILFNANPRITAANIQACAGEGRF